MKRIDGGNFFGWDVNRTPNNCRIFGTDYSWQTVRRELQAQPRRPTLPDQRRDQARAYTADQCGIEIELDDESEEVRFSASLFSAVAQSVAVVSSLMPRSRRMGRTNRFRSGERCFRQIYGFTATVVEIRWLPVVAVI